MLDMIFRASHFFALGINIIASSLCAMHHLTSESSLQLLQERFAIIQEDKNLSFDLTYEALKALENEIEDVLFDEEKKSAEKKGFLALYTEINKSRNRILKNYYGQHRLTLFNLTNNTTLPASEKFLKLTEFKDQMRLLLKDKKSLDERRLYVSLQDDLEHMIAFVSCDLDMEDID